MKDEIVPADMIIIETMDSNHNCYVDASAITGIFDQFLVKKACTDTQAPSMKTIKFNEFIKNIKGMFKYEEPNSDIYNFWGKLKLESFPRSSVVAAENFIMRGSTIKNIKCVYGLVVYTGMETKIMQILKNEKMKNQSIIKEDRNLIHTVLKFIQLLLIVFYIGVIVLLSASHVFKSYKGSVKDEVSGLNHVYLGIDKPYQEFYLTFIQFMLTFHLLIPFNWFNFIMIAYSVLCTFLKWDVKVIQKQTNTVDIINPDCLADFGQVRYILTDKTGTLTSRKFLLKACSIKGKIYSFDPLDRKDENYIFRMKNYDLSDLELYQELRSESAFSACIKEFFEYLCLCHSVKIKSEDKEKGKKETLNQERIFGSCFAEEKSMLKMLKTLGYTVLKTKANKILIDINGENKTYHIIGTNKYTEQRKRMSLIVKKYKNDVESTLLCKGHDMSIFDLIKHDENEAEIKMIKEQIKKLHSIGYRYFILGKKDLSEDETTSYMTKYKSAENFVLQRDFHFAQLAEEYEYDMDILGVLFFEEKVSSDLRFSLNKLNNSNINVWVVSGDGKDNVLSVSKNLDMYKHNSIIVEFTEKDEIDDLDIKMNMYLLQFLGSGDQMFRMKTRKGVDINVEAGNNVRKSKGKELTILIHGDCFNTICNDNRLYQCFATMLSYATNVFAYSFTPNNKFLLCQIVRKYITKNSKVLAIGDGLNDFMMLKEADLSIGIRSREILQVRNTCDVIVSKFPQIVDLILIHGTWNIKRMYNILLFSVYSNFLVIFPYFLHQGINSAGSSFFELNYNKLVLDLTIINLLIICTFCFDQSIERALIGLNPSIYNENFTNKYSIMVQIGRSTSRAIIDSFVIYYCYVVMKNPINIYGESIDGLLLGNVIQFTCYFNIFLKLISIQLHTINVVTVSLFIVAFGAIVGFTFLDEEIPVVCFQALSYLQIALCFFFCIGLCYIYDKFLVSFFLFIESDYMYGLGLKFKKFIDDYVLFINFDDILKEISNVHSNNKKRMDKITYQDVLQKIYQHNENIDPMLDNSKIII